MVQLFKHLHFIHQQALKDLTRSLRKKITIFITIFISVFILFLISTLNQSLLNEVKSNTKTILGGDAEIEITNKKLDIEIMKEIKTFAKISLNTTVSSMVANKKLNPPKTEFVQLRAIDNLYPLYGEFITTKGKVKSDFFESYNLAIINENLAVNLQLKEGDDLIVRDQRYVIHSIIKQMPDLGPGGLFGDLVIISQAALNSMQISSSENFFEYKYKVRYLDNVSDKEGEQALKRIFPETSNTQINFPENATNFIQRVLDNFANFLSLISLAAILIAGIGISNMVIAYINQNYNAIAVQKSLGLSTRIIQCILAYQILIISFVICIIAFLLSSFSPSILSSLLPQELNFSLQNSSDIIIFLKITFIALIAITIFLIPAINSIQQLSPNSLFRNTYEFVSLQFSLKTISVLLSLFFLMIGVFTLGSSLWFYNFIFLIGFLITILLFYGLFKLFILFFKKVLNITNFNLLLAKRNLTSPSSVGPIILTTLGIGISLLLTMLIIAGSFQNIIQKSVDTKAPDFFFISIDQSVKNDFQEYILGEYPDSELVFAPSASARLKEVNGIDPATYIDKGNPSYWVIRSELQFSWFKEPPENNPVVEGEWWSENPTDQMYISFDYNVAQNLGIKINDSITLSLYGRDIIGVVKNFRDVDYSDFELNFVMVLNTNYGESIPHQYISTIKLSDQDNFQEYAILEKFPNISFIKVENLADAIKNLLNQINNAIIALSVIVIFIGLLVISSAILVQGKNKIYQNLVFKILGLKKIEIIKTSLLEFSILFFNTIILTLLVSGIASYLVVKFIFNIDWYLDISSIILVYLSTGIFTMVLIILDTYKNLSPKVYPIIRNN